MKSQYTNNLEVGNPVDSLFAIKVAAATKNDDGKYRLNGELFDATGSIPFVRFDVEENVVQQLTNVRIAGVRGLVNSNKYAPRQVKVSEFYAVKTDDIEDADFEAVSPIPIDAMKKELAEFIDSVEDRDCKNLLWFVFNDPRCPLTIPDSFKAFSADYLTSPGATGHHHAYKSGLLQHTLDVTRAARAIALASPCPLDMDVVITSSLLHDIGKVSTYTKLPNLAGYGMTQRGALLGHITLGLMLINNCICALQMTIGFDDNIGDHILHCIASHHTKKEYGSPVEPMTLEAMCLARADGHDAESFKVRAILDDYTAGHESVKVGDRYYYAKPLSSEAPLLEG